MFFSKNSAYRQSRMMNVPCITILEILTSEYFVFQAPVFYGDIMFNVFTRVNFPYACIKCEMVLYYSSRIYKHDYFLESLYNVYTEKPV
jgi:hypothetical protein